MLREIVGGRAPDEMPAAARRASDSRILGSLDVVQPTRLAGWALDQGRPETPAQIDLLLEGAVIASVTADRHRKDLEKAGIGTGRHGFEAVLAEPLAVELLPRLTVRVRSLDDVEGSIPNRAAAAARPSGDAVLVMAELKELRIAVRELRDLVQPLAESLAERADAIDIAQARLEASAGRMERVLDDRLDRSGRGWGLRATVLGLSTLALLSLGLGIYNLLAR